MSTSQRDQLIQQLNIQVRLVSANSVMFSQAIAEIVGIHPSDNECLDFLMMNGPATAGQLAQLTGLTTGAITAMLDRLEKAGFVKREQHPDDRRKVIVVPNTEKIMAEIMPYARPMATALEKTCTDFSSEELETVLKFIEKANILSTEVIANTRKMRKE